jgi:hypothetical protein
MHAFAASDPIVAAAEALVDLAAPTSGGGRSARALLALNPADPVLARAALRVAAKNGEDDSAALARSVLARDERGQSP